MRSKTEPPTTSCWQAAWVGRHPVMLHPAQCFGTLIPYHKQRQTHTSHKCMHTYRHTNTHTQRHTNTYTHMQWHQLGKFFLTESSQHLEERARSCLCCTEAAYLLCDLYTHEHLSGLGKRTDPSSHCRYRVMFSALQIIIPAAQESSDSSVAMAVSQLLAKSPLLQYKVTTLVSFLHVAMWLASPTGMGTQVTCVIASSGLFPVAEASWMMA